jgi:hypothetical protein|tara:strand:+ start:243 stop:578 length:336 start_codon:yes stop_codon:yes gene_type:complete
MDRTPSTVEEVRHAQDLFREGYNFHEQKQFKEAVDRFKECAMINPFDQEHLDKLTKLLKQGSYKLLQESVAYMGCAATHLHSLVHELTDDQKDLVPIDEMLLKTFGDWDEN